MTAARFALDIDRFIKKDVPEAASRLIRTIALDGLRQLVQMTPVDEGRAQGNWIVSIGQADYSYDPNRLDKVGTATIAEGSRIISQITDPFNVVYLQNNVPYIERLEHGHSKQAPAGMLNVTFANLEARYK